MTNKEIKLISLRDDDFIIDAASYQERQTDTSTASLRGEDDTNKDYIFDNIKFT